MYISEQHTGAPDKLKFWDEVHKESSVVEFHDSNYKGTEVLNFPYSL